MGKMFIKSSVHEFHLYDRLDILELDNIAQDDKNELVYMHLKKSWGRQSTYIKIPVVIKQAGKLKKNPSKKDFIVEFYTLDVDDMFTKEGDLKLGSIAHQKIDEDGKFCYWDKSATVTGYFSEE